MVKQMKASDFSSNGIYYPIVESTTKEYFPSLNKQIEYILANCTLLVFVIAKIKGLPYPSNIIPNANRLHLNVSNGWKAIPYTNGMKLLPNDILEWSCNHVAWFNGDKVYASWWTDYEGTSKGVRNMKLTSTLKDTVDYFYTKYKNRFFHETTFEDECERGGGNAKPSYVIRYADLPKPVERDKTKSQVYVGDIVLNVRQEPSTNSIALGTLNKPNGYFDVSEAILKEDYTWYKLDSGYIAKVKNVEFYKKADTDYKTLYEEAQSKLNKVNELAKEIVELSK